MRFILSIGDTAFGIALSFLTGIFVTSLEWNFYLVLAAASFCWGICAVIKKAIWKECLFFLLALMLGAFYFHFYLDRKAARTSIPIGKKITFSAVVSDEPTPSAKFLIVPANVQPPFSGNVAVFAPAQSAVRYGDLLNITATVDAPDTPGGDPVVFSPKITVLAKHRGFWLREWMIELKLAILDVFSRILPGDQAALLGGITFGSKQNFDAELKSAMATAGLTHLVAISGYNITIVIFAVGEVFGRWLPRRWTFFISVAFLLLFMFMVGGAASGVRAAIMGFLALVARESGKVFSIRNAITITAAMMALQDPTILTQNMSFVLSFLSLLGIVYIGPPLKKLLRYREKGFLDWRESAVTTLSAQLAVMPVLINTFGQFSATAIVANVLVLGTVPLTMFFGLLLAVLGSVSTLFAYFTGKLVGLILGYQLFIIRLFAKFAVPLPVSFNSTFAMFFYYLLLITFIFFYEEP